MNIFVYKQMLIIIIVYLFFMLNMILVHYLF